MKLEFSKDARMDLIDDETYIVTDPCYIFGDLCWDEFCNHILEIDRSNQGSFTYDSFGPVLWSQTRYGDGSYEVRGRLGNKIGEFGVDAGLFCVISKQLALMFNPDLTMDSYCEFIAGPNAHVEVSGECLSGFVNCDTANYEDLSDLDDFDDDWEESEIEDEEFA